MFKTRTGWLGGCAACMLSAVMLLSSCTAAAASAEQTAQEDLAVYQAKLQYYQAQLALLEGELEQMDEQLLLMQSEYADEISRMQAELTQMRENVIEQIGEGQTEQDVSGEVSGVPSTPENTKPTGELQTTAYTYRETEQGIVLTKYHGKDVFVAVPAAMNGKRVVALADSAFAGTAVREVVLPQTVQTLGWFTFYGCSALEKVVIPSSVSNIGYASFDGCSVGLTLHVEPDSYAQKFAASFALRYTTD